MGLVIIKSSSSSSSSEEDEEEESDVESSPLEELNSFVDDNDTGSSCWWLVMSDFNPNNLNNDTMVNIPE